VAGLFLCAFGLDEDSIGFLIWVTSSLSLDKRVNSTFGFSEAGDIFTVRLVPDDGAFELSVTNPGLPGSSRS
jgi:hypothetical protein